MNQRLIAIYPINNLDSTTGQLNWPKILSPPDLDMLNRGLTLMRYMDLCFSSLGCNRLYYGVLRGPDFGGLSNGIPGTVASGTMPDEPFVYGRNRHAHELGHLLGLNHTVTSSLGLTRNGDKQGWCTEIADPNAPDFPYDTVIDGQHRYTIGPMNVEQNALIYGLDTHSINVVDPNQNFELMSYCGNPTRWRWISNVTYEGIRTSLNNNFPIPVAVVATGTMQDYSVVRGIVDIKNNTAEFQPFGSIYSPVSPPIQPTGDYTLRLLDAGNNTISEITFKPTQNEADYPAVESNIGTFIIPLKINPAIKQAVILHNGTILTSRKASQNPPKVQVLFPNGGETLNQDPVILKWNGSDPDGDALTYDVQYSSNGGTTWETLAVDWPTESYELNLSYLNGTKNGLIRVTASDGFNTATNESGQFSVPNHAPRISIQSPTENDLFAGNQQISFEAFAQDTEDGSLSDSNIKWTSSIDGFLGTGKLLNIDATNLSEGNHIITATAMDSGGLNATALVNITVSRAIPPTNADLSVTQIALSDPVVMGNNLTYKLTVSNNGPDAATGIMLTDTLPADVKFVSATSTQGTFAQVGSNVTFNLGTLADGNSTNVMIVVTPTAAGQISNIVRVMASETDPIPANNVASLSTMVTSDILSYYRSLGSNPNVVETTDLLKAADDWSNNVAPPGFASPITTQQLLTLADEWSRGG